MAEIAHCYSCMGLHKNALTNDVDTCAQVEHSSLFQSTSSEAISAGSFEGCGRQSKRPAPSAWRKRHNLKRGFVQRKPQDCMAANNGEQFSMKEEQVSCA